MGWTARPRSPWAHAEAPTHPVPEEQRYGKTLAPTQEEQVTQSCAVLTAGF